MLFFIGFSRVWFFSVILAIGFVLYCVQIVILGFSTVVAHLPRFPVNPIAKTLKLISFELKKGEIPPFSELVHGLEQALGCIQQLEAVVHSER